MREKILVCVLLFITLLSCEVSFHPDLRVYIKNIEARTPLNFTLSESVIIDDGRALNLGFSLTSLTQEYTIVNNENVDIKLDSFDGLSGDFTVASFEAFTLKKGDSFTFTLAYNVLDTNFNSRVSEKITFKDIDGREFVFSVWATSKRQPLVILDGDSLVIKEYDLGVWGDGRTYSLTLKNEGLENINVSSINPPSGVQIIGTSNFDLKINEERVIELKLTDTGINNAGTATGSFLEFHSNHSLESLFKLPIFSGGDLMINVLDSGSTVISGDIIFGLYSSGGPIILNLFLDNFSPFDMEIEASLIDNAFSTDISNSSLNKDTSLAFIGSFLPSSSGMKYGSLIIRDSISNRSKTFQLVGNSL